MVLVTLLVVLFTASLWDRLLESGLRWLYILFFAWSLAAVLTPIAIALSRQTKCMDYPSGRKDHSDATPLLGGLAIIGAFGLALLVSFHYSAPMKGVGLGGLLIWLLGVLDDRYSLSASLKLIVQLAAVAILFLFNVHFTFLPNTPVGIAGEYLLTAVWVIGILNAVNFLDGMDGLASGMSAIIAGFLALVALQTNQYYFSAVALALLGACVGFLPYNFRWKRSARIFLGDNGSTFLGFILASAAIMGDWAEDDVAALIVPIVLMGVPIFDMTMTTVTRFGTGKVRTLGQWLSYTGRDHLHHRLAALGIGRGTAVLVIWALTFFLGITAVMLTHAEECLHC